MGQAAAHRGQELKMNKTVATPLPAQQVQPLLEELATWGNTTTIVIHHGCVFEFKGRFPTGSVAEGYYNLGGPVPGFHGHLRLDGIARVSFQDRPHRGRTSYAFVFETQEGEAVFKVFLGRDEAGDLLPEQVGRFLDIREQLKVA